MSRVPATGFPINRPDRVVPFLSQSTSNNLATKVTPLAKVKGKAYALVGGGLSGNSDQATLQLGLGYGAKLSHVSTKIIESISLTYKEARQVNGMGNDSWSVGDVSPLFNDAGDIRGFRATVYTTSHFSLKKNNVPTGIKVFSRPTVNKRGQTVSSGIWSSDAYREEVNKDSENH